MLAVVILNYNTWEETIKCVKSIQFTNDLFRIYIVDNASPNDSYEKLKDYYSLEDNIEVINSGGNLGYARGNNIGIKKALKDGADLILISNNDIIFKENSINNMCAELNKNDNITCVTPVVLTPEDVVEMKPYIAPITIKDYLFIYTRLNKLLIRDENILSKYQLNEIKGTLNKIYKFSGCCFMIKSEDFEKVGFFDENTFMYFEEDILCYKLKELGYESYQVNNAFVQHFHGKTTGNGNYFVYSEMFKSELYYYIKYRNLKSFGLVYLYFDRVLTPLVKLIKGNKFTSFREYRKLIKDTLKIIKFANKKS